MSLVVGSPAWIEALKSHTEDFDVKLLCEIVLKHKMVVDDYHKKIADYEDRLQQLNVLLARVTGLAEQMTRAVGTMTDMTKEKVHGEG